MLYGFSELDQSPLYPKYLAFRHSVFASMPGYRDPGGSVSTFGPFPRVKGSLWSTGVEFDDCDTPKTIHFAHVGPARPHTDAAALIERGAATVVTGAIRMLPTDAHYMIRDALDRKSWGRVRLLERLPQSYAVYEASRIAVSGKLRRGSAARKLVLDRLVYGHIELAVRLGVERLIGIMYERVWNAVYVCRGVAVRYISEPFTIGDDPHPVIMGTMNIDAKTLRALSQNLAPQLDAGLVAPAIVNPELVQVHREHVSRTRGSTGDRPKRPD